MSRPAPKPQPQPRADVTDAELAVLQLLWDRGPATVRQLADVLYPGGDPAHYGTVQKLLQRLAHKRCVARVARRSPVEFTAKVAREALIDLRLRGVLDQLCAGSLTPLLSRLIERSDLTDQERGELERFLDELERRVRPARKPAPRKP
jgi:predicted transcriptional regulator